MLRIMIVDDVSYMRLLLKTMLEASGYEVVAEAASGEEAIEKYAIYRPDLVTMDITMPGMHGIDATKAIIHKDPSAIIIMCSAIAQKDFVLQAIRAGAKDFIAKPFQTYKILNTIESLLAK
ncbi:MULTISPECIES: response regulator [unclassified Paenibacillus]|uniref:response regulator n=1 Tax=unclassified Paenibacillus TaxID=185978 RepID=UPI00070F8A6B|nr:MULTISPECIES: response regulator [unclassified Paenibacillus]KQX46968.1 two-component system response regulator [Paenibacillus sp. Root444D2]KRE48333.1 two-component system response regulator [Paenibacillus sp. Soil724D2]